MKPIRIQSFINCWFDLQQLSRFQSYELSYFFVFLIWFTEDLILIKVSCITLTIPSDKMGKRKGKSVRKNKQVKEQINLNRDQFSM